MHRVSLASSISSDFHVHGGWVGDHGDAFAFDCIDHALLDRTLDLQSVDAPLVLIVLQSHLCDFIGYARL